MTNIVYLRVKGKGFDRRLQRINSKGPIKGEREREEGEREEGEREREIDR